MKNFLSAFTLLLLCTTAAQASQCVSDGLMIWPRGGSLYQNSRIMVESTMESETGLVRRALKDSVTFVLKSGKSTVKLKIAEFDIGDYHTTQIFLIPEKTLQEGKIYTLFAEGATWQESNQLAAFNPVWTASDSVKLFNPLEKFEPKISLTANSPQSRYGVGKHVVFKTNLYTDNLFLKVKLTTLDADMPERIFYYQAKSGELAVSGAMCANGILLQGEHQYSVEITLVDAAGNSGETKTLEFSI